MNTFFIGLDLLSRTRNLTRAVTAMVAPDSRIHASVVMLPVPVSAAGRRQNLTPRPVRDQRLGYKAYLLFGVSKASAHADSTWARDAVCALFR